MSSGNKFKIGDRLAIYGYAVQLGRTTPDYLRGHKATVTQVIFDDELVVETHLGFKYNVHPNQCRRLKKKEPPRRVWLRSRGKMTPEVWDGFGVPGPNTGFIEFIEVKKKK